MSDTNETTTSEPVEEANRPDPSARTAGFATPGDSVGAYLRERWNAVRAGELGSLPIIGGLIVIVAVFGLLEDQFLTSRNFTNVLLQMAPISFLAIGIIFILLIADGEVVTIDLSVAFVAATGGTVLVLLQRPGDPGWPWWAALLVCVVLTTAIGLLHALIITKLGVPSFVLTLAGFLVWSGVVLWLTLDFTDAGFIRIQDQRLIDIANKFFSDDWVGVGVGCGRRDRVRGGAADRHAEPASPRADHEADRHHLRSDRRCRGHDDRGGRDREP
jgi:D-xylose transport system permease protein